MNEPPAFVVVAAIGLAVGGLLGLASMLEIGLAIRDAAGVDAGLFDAVRTRLAAGFGASAGLATLTAAIAWKGRRSLAWVPAALLFGGGGLGVPLLVGAGPGWVTRLEPGDPWAPLAVVVEMIVIAAPAGFVPSLYSDANTARSLAFSSGLVGVPVLTAVWLVSMFTFPTTDQVVLTMASAIAVVIAGVASDMRSSGGLPTIALAAAVTVRFAVGPQTAVLFTACLIAGVAAPLLAATLWEHRSTPIGELLATR